MSTSEDGTSDDLLKRANQMIQEAMIMFPSVRDSLTSITRRGKHVVDNAALL